MDVSQATQRVTGERKVPGIWTLGAYAQFTAVDCYSWGCLASDVKQNLKNLDRIYAGRGIAKAINTGKGQRVYLQDDE